MASSSKFVCLFLLITLSFTLQTYARDSQFFSKVTRNRDPTTTTTTTATNTKDDGEFVHLNKQEDQQQPAFIPQTTETGYGLYGHDTGLNPPSTTTTTTATATTSYNNENKYENFNNNNNNYDENNFSFNKKNNNNYENLNNYYKSTNNENHEKNYAPELKGLSGTSKYFSNNYNNGESNYYGARYNGGVEKQGISDTRFLENGKYYYDLNAENNFDANNNNYKNNYNNNNNNGYYGNFYSENGMQRFQNQVPEEEFDFDQP